MKTKHLFFIILLLTIIVPIIAADGVSNPNLWATLSPLIVLIISPLLVRLFKKLGIDISQSIIEPILIKIIEIIAHVEGKYPDQIGSYKKIKAVEIVQKSLSPKEINIVNKVFGSVTTAVQAAFEKTHIASK